MKKILPLIIIFALAGCGGFYGGMKYASSRSPFGGGALKAGARGGNFQQFGNGKVGGQGGGMAAGEIIAKDDKSITIKLRDGGSKTVYYSDSTKVTKTADGAASDLKVGDSVMANGNTTQEGVMTATIIQLQPFIIQTAPANK